MPTFSHGSKAKIYANGYDLTAFFNSASVDANRDTAEVSVFGNAFKDFLVGQYGATFSADGFYSGSATDAQMLMDLALRNGTPVIWSYLPEGEAAQTLGFGFSSYQNKHTITSSITEANRISLGSQATGPIVGGISLGPLTQLTNAVPGTTGVDLGAGFTAYTKVRAVVHVTQIGGGDSSVALIVQGADSADFVTAPTTFITLATATAIGAQISAEATITGKRYLRILGTLTAGETCTVQGILYKA
jgi:hypothetical protein